MNTSIQGKNESRTSESSDDKPASSSGQKSSNVDNTEPTKPAHIHDYQPVEGTETVTYEIPIIGDRCSTCNKDITGIAEKHISDTSCRGYATDVVVGYETVTEEIPCIYYKCSCGEVMQ